VDTLRVDQADAAQIELAVLSRQGGRSTNQDACGHWHSDRRVCCVVADGAGGHGGGDIASKLVVRHIIDQAALAPLGSEEEVRELLTQTNAHLVQHQSDTDGAHDMHSTVVALFIDIVERKAIWGHSGDSRLYVFRDGRMLSHTRDHSLVQLMVDAGMLMPEDMRTHPRRSELQSALGSRPEDLLISTAAQPWHLEAQDVFLLCTDGLWEFVDESEMCATLVRASDPGSWLEALEQLVLQHAVERGRNSHDNFSGIAVWVRGG
jgi:serine/threonine protein phosphatase PrpC